MEIITRLHQLIQAQWANYAPFEPPVPLYFTPPHQLHLPAMMWIYTRDSIEEAIDYRAVRINQAFRGLAETDDSGMLDHLSTRITHLMNRMPEWIQGYRVTRILHHEADMRVVGDAYPHLERVHRFTLALQEQ